MTFYEAAKLAKDADVKALWLTHYSPSLNRPEEYMDEVRRIFPRAEAGKDRKSIELDFEEAVIDDSYPFCTSIRDPENGGFQRVEWRLI